MIDASCARVKNMLANWLKSNKGKTAAEQLKSLNNNNSVKRSSADDQEDKENCTGAEQQKKAKVAAEEEDEFPLNDLPVLERKTMHETWLKALYKEFKKPYFTQLKSFLEREQKSKVIYPPQQDIYSWSRYCPLDRVKVVIIGQDPYHNVNQAHGLCFSVRKGVPMPPSLVNIFKCIKNDKDIKDFVMPQHGCLVGWADQGVLLLNAVLTVEAHKANSQSGKGWEKLTDAVIKCVSSTRENVVYMLWGNYAAKKALGLNERRNLVLKSVHPSPLSAHRGFMECKHFSKANNYLTEHGQDAINWSNL